MSWNNFFTAIRNANPDLDPQVANVFKNIGTDNPLIYWCPNTGRGCEPLKFDAPVQSNPFSGRLYRTNAEQLRTPKMLVWINEVATQNWMQPVQGVDINLLQSLQQPIENCQQDALSLKVFEVSINARADQEPYVIFVSKANSEAMIKQVFAHYGLHIRVAALVKSDLQNVGESAEGLFQLLNNQPNILQEWQYIIAPRDTQLPGWNIPEGTDNVWQGQPIYHGQPRTPRPIHADGWGNDTLWLWKRNPRLQA